MYFVFLLYLHTQPLAPLLQRLTAYASALLARALALSQRSQARLILT